ncbi:response regulator [Omnitrophica bacterium]|nr:response regulator [Candidatus Omnitrophota bacterium]
MTSRPGRILVIDDDPLLVKTLSKVLSKAGHLVDTAANGEEGIQKAKYESYHLILCDLKMPGLDGIMTLQRIQSFQEKAGKGQSGFIMISAYGTDEHRHRARQLGVSDFISKPFDLEAFLASIDRHLQPLLPPNPGPIKP